MLTPRPHVVAGLIISALVCSTMAPPATETAAAAIANPVVQRLQPNLGANANGAALQIEQVLGVSDNGRYLSVQTTADGSPRSFHIDLETGDATRLSGAAFEVEDNGQFVHWRNPNNFSRVPRMASRERVGSLQPEVVRPVSIDLGYGETRRPPTVIDRTDDGRYVILEAEPPNWIEDSVFAIWDTVANAPVASRTDVEFSDTDDQYRFSNDDQFVISNTSGGVPYSVEIIELATGDVVTRNLMFPAMERAPEVSPGGRLAAYTVPDSDGPRPTDNQLFRVDLATRSEVEVPVEQPEGANPLAWPLRVNDDGAVIYAMSGGEGPLPGTLNTLLFRWLGPGSPVEWLNPGTDGGFTEATLLTWSADGSRLVFGSSSANLPGADGDGELDFYTIDFAAGVTPPAALPAPWPSSPSPNPNGSTVGFSRAPIEQIELGDIELGDDSYMSDNGLFATVDDTSGAWYHLDLTSGDVVPLATTDARPESNGTHVVNFEYDAEYGAFRTTRRERVGSGVSEEFNPREFDFGHGEAWTTPIAVESTPDERYTLVYSASRDDNSIQRYVVWDNVLNDAVTPLDGFGPPEEVVLRNVEFVPDSTAVRFRTQASANASVYETFERLDFVTGERTIIERPGPSWRRIHWWVSTNFEWMVYQSSEFNVIDGLDAGPRLYREHIPSGRVDVVVTESFWFTPRLAFVSDAGSIFHTGRTNNQIIEHIAAWSGGPTSGRLLTATSAGMPTEAGADWLGFGDDGSTIIFASRASDIDVSDLDLGGDDSERRLFVIREQVEVEPPIDPLDLTAPARANERSTRCSMSPAC